MQLGNFDVKFYHKVGKNSNKTVCRVTNGSTVTLGESKCGASDAYTKNIGRKISLGRALNSSNATKEERTAVWNDYKNRCNL